MRRTAYRAAGAAALGLVAGAADPPGPAKTTWTTPGAKPAAAATVARSAPPVQAPPAAAGAIAATVNGETIRLEEVDAQIKRRPPVGGPLTAAQARELRLAVTHDLTDDLLVKQYMRKHGPKVDPAEVENHLRALADAQRKQGKTLADYLRETGQTEAQVREAWTALLQFARLVEKEATPDRLRKYYEAYKEHFDRVEVRVSHIVVRVGPKAPVGERQAAREKLAKLKAEIAAGAVTFADAAKKHSFCPSAPAGGDLGYITRRDGVADEGFARAAFALKVGEVSDPVDTDFGVHLIRATDRKPGTPSTFEKAVELVKDCYADDVRRALIEKLRKEATIQVTVP
jgi:peptidyl-prolyl cis-trans isomerase C